jgi:uncharacterized lipoprotein YddW (UPF0748 family)
MLHLIPLLALILLLSCKKESDRHIVGAKIYAYPGNYTDLFSQWKRLGINTAFASQELISLPEFRNAAKAQNISTFVIFPVFFNPEELARSPGLYAITAEGEAAREEWVEFVCPSRTAYRKQIVDQARQVILNYDPDGLSIDFIRHFVFWEKVYPDRDPATLPLTCFDSVCLAAFRSESGISIPDTLGTVRQKSAWILDKHPQEWIRCRSGLITSMVQEISEAARELKPGILINLHLLPWAEGDFQEARKNVAGQDVLALSGFSDYLSPMTYAHMVKQDPPWIHAIVEDVYMKTGADVLPSIQVDKAYLDTELGVQEFEQSLTEALKPPSRGVVFWSWESLMESPEKIQVVLKHCQQARKF